ncbi:hypothetical protein EXS54_00730 [Patescibacteria group bacterium]|nr:hypothetical protein [Patescibacteria group bacterium]
MSPEQSPEQAAPYREVDREESFRAVIEYLRVGGQIPICQPEDKDRVQVAIQRIRDHDGFDDEKRERLKNVPVEMVDHHGEVAERRAASFAKENLESAVGHSVSEQRPFSG